MPVTLLKSLSSWLAIASGGSLGREGPLIQFGGALGKWLSDALKLPMTRTRVLIAAGTAAGFTAAYNTPLAAVLFVLEVVVGVAALDTIVPALIATVVASALTRAVVGEGPIYGQRAFHLSSPLELVAFGGLGLFGAVGAHASFSPANPTWPFRKSPRTNFTRLSCGPAWNFTNISHRFSTRSSSASTISATSVLPTWTSAAS